MPAVATLDTVKLFVNGRLVESKSTRRGQVFNPSIGEPIAEVPFCSAEETAGIVQAAHAAFPKWRDTPVVERARVMFRLVNLLEKNADSLARTLSLEHGKTHEEAVGSIRRGIEMVEFACSIPSLTMGDTIHNLALDVDCETYSHPLGVCVGITPYNFPFMVPLWMFPIAVTCGNTFVLKPSEKVPLSAMRIAELAAEAGLPPGVLNVVHGDKECVDTLLTHPLVQAVSFVGSTPIAKYIYETATKHGKRCQANGGAKNHILVMPDADLDKAVSALQTSAFGCAGQRCMAGSLAVAIGTAADPLVKSLVASADRMRVGRTDLGSAGVSPAGGPLGSAGVSHAGGAGMGGAGLGSAGVSPAGGTLGSAGVSPAVDMGPVTTKPHLEMLLSNIDKGAKEGAKLARDGRGVKVPDAPKGFYLGPTIFDHVEPNMLVSKAELFGPVLSVSRVATLDDAIELTNKSEFGNGAVIYTRDGHAAREFKHRAGAGMIGVNVGVPAPMAMFPFTGAKGSFFGDLHIQGKEGIMFYTQSKMILSRWHQSASAGEFVTTRG